MLMWLIVVVKLMLPAVLSDTGLLGKQIGYYYTVGYG